VRLRKQVSTSPVPSASVATTEPAPPSEFQIDTGEIHERDRVRIKSFGQEGTVESISDGEYTVLVGSLRLRASRDDIQLLKIAAPQASSPVTRLPRGVSADVDVDEHFSPEINVIGSTVDEAVDRVDKFLDEAVMAGAESVRVIHGHGKGALRKAVAELLTGHAHVERFNTAPANQGGAGATVATLKK
jgi:DNA mismatch repair protein MutS2